MVASSREDAWIETVGVAGMHEPQPVASSREDAWIETFNATRKKPETWSRPPARTRGLKLEEKRRNAEAIVASSREDAWIETMKVHFL